VAFGLFANSLSDTVRRRQTLSNDVGQRRADLTVSVFYIGYNGAKSLMSNCSENAFLWGPRKTGKSYWLQQNYSGELLLDFLKTDLFAEYAAKPSILRERYSELPRTHHH